MAPEQLEGQEADERTDIFAFGAVLYEMITGRKAFEGKSQATLIAAIISSDPPPISQLVPLTPPAVDRVVTKCLAKNADDRWQGAKDLCDELKWAAAATVSSAVAVTSSTSSVKRSNRLVWTLATVAVMFMAVAIALATAMWLARAAVLAPTKIAFDIETGAGPNALHIAVSPDGTQLETIVSTPQGTVISLRRLDDVTARTLPDTAGAQFPFWSPDSRSLAFFASGKLYKIDAAGGPAQPLCDAPAGRGGTWNRDGVIVFAPSDGPLFSVSAAGAAPVPVTALDRTRGETAHRHPKFLPDGHHFVFFVASNQPAHRGLYLGALGSTVATRLVASDAMGVFAPPHHLLFVRGSTLMAQRFDPLRLALAGDPVPVAQDVGVNVTTSVSGVTVSDTGVLAYRMGPNASNRLLRWVNRSGRALGQVGSIGAHENVRLAPDGERLVETHLDESGSMGNLWIVDLLRGPSSRLTSNPATADNGVWSPDGQQIVFGSARDGIVRNLYLTDAAGTGHEVPLLKTDASKYPTDWSQDGKYLLYTEAKNQNDVWVLQLSDKKPIPFLQTSYEEDRARFSPDGHWIAYTSNETGRVQVYVQHFPPNGVKVSISAAGGLEPHWRLDGRELFYYLSGGSIWAVDISATESGSFKPGLPRKLFDTGNLPTDPLGTFYDVAADGQRFLLNVNPLTVAGPPVRVVVNWATGLEK
jgi:Tol biopolymer transport system component